LTRRASLPVRWAAKGQRGHGLQSGQQRPRTNLIGAYRQRKLLAPMLFEGRCNTEVFNHWLEHMLLPQLTAGWVLVLDNATFHTFKRTQEWPRRSAASCCI
jgi:hypothetical protein